MVQDDDTVKIKFYRSDRDPGIARTNMRKRGWKVRHNPQTGIRIGCLRAILITSQNRGILFAAHLRSAKLAATTKINGTLFCGVGSYATLFYMPCFLPACVRNPFLLVRANPGCSQHQ